MLEFKKDFGLEEQPEGEFFQNFYREFVFVMDTIRPELTASEFQIYLTLIRKSWARNQDFLQVSISELVRETGLAIMTVKTALRNLANKRLIKVAAKQTNNSSRSYKVFRPQELQYYNEAFYDSVIKRNLDLNPAYTGGCATSHTRPGDSIPNASSGSPFVSLDNQDRSDLMVIVGSLAPDKLTEYRNQAEEALRDSGAELTEANIQGKRNEVIFFATFGPMRTEKYIR